MRASLDASRGVVSGSHWWMCASMIPGTTPARVEVTPTVCCLRRWDASERGPRHGGHVALGARGAGVGEQRGAAGDERVQLGRAEQVRQRFGELGVQGRSDALDAGELLGAEVLAEP